ncbi:M48 family metalloprotease, partial [bacterium]|nr:M48 family metalloprotease [bacterium]
MVVKKIIITAVVLALLAIQCATNYVTGERQFMLISEDEEINLGTNYAPEVTYEFGGIYDDSELNEYVNEVGKSLAKVSHRPNLNYTFRVANSSIVNAFALPGGYIYITRGMLNEFHNEAELAAVLGHEIGHVTARHSASQMSKAMGFQYVMYAGLTIDQIYHQGRKAQQIRNLVALGSTVVFQMVSLGYGRKNEFQADELGAEYMTKAGYDPDGMIGVMNILEGMHENEPGKLAMLFASHPKTSERKAKVQNLADTYKSSGEFQNVDGNLNEDRFTIHLQDMKDAQKAYEKYDAALEDFSKDKKVSAIVKLSDAMKIRDDQAPFYNLMGNIYFDEKSYEKAKKEYEKALKLDSTYVFSYYNLANCEKKLKNYGNAEKHYKKALDLYP